MRKPRALSPGDRIAVVAPASSFRRDYFDAGIAELKRLGFVPVYDDSVFAKHGEFVAGTAEARAQAITSAWQDPSIAGVIAVRGGYGSAQTLPFLDPDDARRASKPFIGYSDLTSVLTFLNMNCGMVAFHGPMLDGRLGGDIGYDPESFMKAITVRAPMGELAPAGLETIREGETSGLLFGGTLTQLLASIGTPFAFDPPAGHVLFIEEVGERPYRLDRMVVQLRQTGLLARAVAVVINELRGCDEPGGQPTGRATMADLFADFPGPVLIGFPSGHVVAPMLTLPLGVRCRVIAGARPRIVIEESAVA
jgi:muramoyltetrapeptide carboxypeptidase